MSTPRLYQTKCCVFKLSNALCCVFSHLLLLVEISKSLCLRAEALCLNTQLHRVQGLVMTTALVAVSVSCRILQALPSFHNLWVNESCISLCFTLLGTRKHIPAATFFVDEFPIQPSPGFIRVPELATSILVEAEPAILLAWNLI